MLENRVAKLAVGLIDWASGPMQAGAVRNARAQVGQSEQLFRIDLALFERLDYVHPNLLSVAENDPDRMKEPDVPDELRSRVDQLLFAQLLRRDWAELSRGKPASDRLEAVAAQPGQLESLGLESELCRAIRQRLGIDPDDSVFQHQLLARALHPSGSVLSVDPPALPPAP